MLHRGASLTAVGLSMSIGGLLALVVAAPLAGLLGRAGARPGLVALHIGRAATFLAMPLVPPRVALVLIALGVVQDRTASPLSQAFLSLTVPAEQRAALLALRRSAANVGLALGTGAGGLILAVRSDAAYAIGVLANGLSYAAAATIVLAVPDQTGVVAAPAAKPRPSTRGWAGMLPLIAGLGVLTLYESILTFGVPALIAGRSGIPPWFASLAFAVNFILVMALQIPVTGVLERRRTPLPRVLICSGIAVGLGVLALAGADASGRAVAAALVIAAVVVLTVGELLAAYAQWQVPLVLADDRELTAVTTRLSLSSNAAAVTGPWLLSAVVLPTGAPALAALAILLPAGSLLASSRLTRLTHHAPEEAPR